MRFAAALLAALAVTLTLTTQIFGATTGSPLGVMVDKYLSRTGRAAESRVASRAAPKLVLHRPLNCGRMQPRNALHCAKAQLHKAHVQLRHPSTRHSPGYWHWRVKVTHRWIRQAHRLLNHTLPWTGDWVTAVRIVQRVWPGTQAWMLSCSAHEGGHGPFVMNYQGSGAGGWMQYMEGTFNAHYSGALALARATHRPVPPPVAASWTSPLGQAFAAGWGYWHNRSAWAGNPYCA